LVGVGFGGDGTWWWVAGCGVKKAGYTTVELMGPP
jgi:hypothetical protein